MKLYSELASWWPLLSSPSDYADEAERHWRLISQYADGPIETMLELGCGGGNNAIHLKHKCRMTLSDVSVQMLAVSRAANPECEHVEGDMRSMQLGREFDAVFVHDAVMYMCTEADLFKAMKTAFVHCRSGGVAMFVPDCTRETWEPSTSHGGHDGPGRALRYLEWTWDPDPADTEYAVEMVYLLREGGAAPRLEHERHRFGLFPRSTWVRLLEEAGFCPAVEPCRYPGGQNASAFLGLRPPSPCEHDAPPRMQHSR
jgi:SAM-dependent methyltransferase